MITKRLPQLVCLVSAVFVLGGSSSGDAATPDAVAAVEEADSIMGGWVLNREESDDPREAMQGDQEQGGRAAGGRRGGRSGGSSSGRRPRSRSTTGRQVNVSPEQRQRIQLSIRNAMGSPSRLEISRTDSTVTIQTPQGNRILFTDNREVTVPIGPDLDSTVKCKWDKNKLVIESQTDAGVKTKYTYERNDNQLKVQVRIDVRRPRQVIRFELVYDAS
ncbi:MAG: hypothetical protein IIB35_00755 [Gemmatimonadetes bacterium]|nr:hypothetical protein [Gemmatimonadota bacterium]